MDQLPDELLLMIFEMFPPREMLSGVARVCRRWATLVEQRVLNVERYFDLRRIGPGLLALQVSGRLDSVHELLAITARIASRLTSLTVHAITPFRETHITALRSLRHLKHLDVFTYSHVFDPRILDAVPRLESLVINERVTSCFISELTVLPMRALHMYGYSLYYPWNELLICLRGCRDYLRDLTLRCTELTDVSYEIIGECYNLDSLRLYSCFLMTGDGVLHTARPLRLQCLHLTGTRLVRRADLAELIEQLPPALNELVLSSSCFDDEHVSGLSGRMMNLRVLELWQCQLSAHGAVALAMALPELQMFDINLELHNTHMRALLNHPSLKRLRCRLSSTTSQELADESECIRNGTKRLRIESSDARYASKYVRVRGHDEGFRANLFYYSILEQDLVSVFHGGDNDTLLFY